MVRNSPLGPAAAYLAAAALSRSLGMTRDKVKMFHPDSSGAFRRAAAGLPEYIQGMADERERGLIERSRERDEAAQSELFAKYQPQVYRWALRMVRRVEDAQDVMQEVFLRAFRGLPEYRGESKFSVWLYRITYNLSLDWLTRKRKEHVPFEEEFHSPAEETPALDDERVLAELENLPARYSMVLTFYYLRGMSYQEIADMLNLPINTVKTHLRRAKDLLRERMKGKKG